MCETSQTSGSTEKDMELKHADILYNTAIEVLIRKKWIDFVFK